MGLIWRENLAEKKVAENTLFLETVFDVILKDHKIEITKLVFKKIAVNAKLSYSQYQK
jgi:hypothetical protein